MPDINYNFRLSFLSILLRQRNEEYQLKALIYADHMIRWISIYNITMYLISKIIPIHHFSISFSVNVAFNEMTQLQSRRGVAPIASGFFLEAKIMTNYKTITKIISIYPFSISFSFIEFFYWNEAGTIMARLCTDGILFLWI